MRNQRPTFKDYTTLTSQIEVTFKSRPLTEVTSDPSELRQLTPGPFLICQPHTKITDPSVLEIPINRLSRWQLIQQMNQSF